MQVTLDRRGNLDHTQISLSDRLATHELGDHLANDFNENIIETCHRSSPLAARRYPRTVGARFLSSVPNRWLIYRDLTFDWTKHGLKL